MMNEVVLKVDNLGKCFKLYSNPWKRALEWVAPKNRNFHKEFWALRNVSFKMYRKEFLGIIGPNGAGKSTLLKLISGVLVPTEGTYSLEGRVLSMIEISSGMNPNLTGRDNAIRTAQLARFPENYINERMGQIKAFSELEDFFERPIRLYSRGMRTRLSFSLFAFLDCDLLVLDEVLAVGDIFFKQKCFARLEDLIKKGTSIILVSHSLNAIQHFSDRVIVINRGQKIFEGEPEKAVRTYMQIRDTRREDYSHLIDNAVSVTDRAESPVKIYESVDLANWPSEDVFNLSQLKVPIRRKSADLNRLLVCDQNGKPCLAFKQGETAHFYYEFLLKQDIGTPLVGVELTDQYNTLVHRKDSSQHNVPVPKRLQNGDILRIHQSLKLGVAPGQFVFGLNLHTVSHEEYDNLGALSPQEILKRLTPVARIKRAGALTVMPGKSKQSPQTHWGIVDLPGEMNIALINMRQDESNDHRNTYE